MNVELKLRRAALVLGGAGFMTAHQVGILPHVLRFFKEHDVKVSLISGASGGAINGGTLAAQTNGLFAQSIHLKRVWNALDDAGPNPVFPCAGWGPTKIAFTVGNPSIQPSDSLYGLVDGKLFSVPQESGNEKKGAAIDTAQIVENKNKCRFDISVQNETTGDYEIFSSEAPRTSLAHQDELRHAIVASASLPVFFPAVVIDGVPYSDCGYIRTRHAFDMGVDLILVLLPYPEREPVSQGDSWVSRSWVFRQSHISSARIRQFNSKVVREAIERARLVRQAGVHAPWIEALYMGAARSSLKGYNFNPGDLKWAMEVGEHDAQPMLTKLKEVFDL